MKIHELNYDEIWQALNDVVRRTKIIAEVLERKIKEEKNHRIVEQLNSMRNVLLHFDAAVQTPLNCFPSAGRFAEPLMQTLWAGEQGCGRSDSSDE